MEGENWLFLRRLALACPPRRIAHSAQAEFEEGEEAFASGSRSICNCRQNLILYPRAV